MRPLDRALRGPLPWIGAAAVLVFAAGLLAPRWANRAARAVRQAHPPPLELHALPSLELRAPRVDRPIPIDGDVEAQAAWESEVGDTGVLQDSQGRRMVPYSEARVRWGEGMLYIWLYAGDLDLQGAVAERDGPVLKDDAFHVELGRDDRVYTLDVSVLGTLADAECTGRVGASLASCNSRWESGAVTAVDRDGTVNEAADNDEEWIVEMAIPLASLGLESAKPGTRVPFAVRRCDVGQDGARACGSFGMGSPRGELVLGEAQAKKAPPE